MKMVRLDKLRILKIKKILYQNIKDRYFMSLYFLLLEIKNTKMLHSIYNNSSYIDSTIILFHSKLITSHICTII